jgi:hypothetical protein
MIDAIKHVIDTNNIQLSQSTNASFKHLAKTSADYPYMKTALEKRMI